MPVRRSSTLPQLPEFIVEDAAGLRECLDHLQSQAHIGYDTEFVGEETYRPDLCLIQLSTSERLYLVDPLRCGSLDAFWVVLADPARQVIVHAGREELRACQFALGRPPAHVFDVQIAAGLIGLQYPIGYAALTLELLGIRASQGRDAHGLAAAAVDRCSTEIRLRRRSLPPADVEETARPPAAPQPRGLGRRGFRRLRAQEHQQRASRREVAKAQGPWRL